LKENQTGQKSIKEKMVDVLALPKESSGTVTLVHITDNEEAIIEGYKGIVEYTDVSIRLMTHKFMLKISGKNLEIKSIASEYISIIGSISGVEYII
jgi:sporulation protein YqfC